MKKALRSFTVGLTVAISLGYLGTYCYYRLYDAGAVLDHYGAYGHGNRAFTFSEHSRSMGDLCIGDSFSGASIVSRVSHLTGLSIAPTVNRLFGPLARLDYLFTGHWITFCDDIDSGSVTPTVIGFDLSDSEVIEFEGFVSYQP